MIKTLKERLVYENRFAKVFDDDVEFPDGTHGRYFTNLWKAPFGVAIVPAQNDHVLLISIFRYKAFGPTLEIPKGFGKEATPAEASAHAELFEETGYTTDALHFLMELGVTYKTFVYVADIATEHAPSTENSEYSEDIRGYSWLPVLDINIDTMRDKNIVDEVTVASLLALRTYYKE